MSKNYKVGVVVTGDSRGGVQAIQLTREELNLLAKKQRQVAAQSKSFAQDVADSLNISKVGLAGFTAAAISGTAALAGFAVTDRINALNELVIMSQTLGMSSKDLSEWVYAASTVNVSAEKLMDMFKDLADKTGDFAETAGGEAKDIFKGLAQDIATLENQTPDQIILKFGAALEKVDSQTRKIFFAEAFANDLSRLLPLLEDGAKGFHLSTEAARKFGLSLSGLDAQKISEAATATALLDKSMEGLGNKIAIAISPEIAETADYLANNLHGLAGAAGIAAAAVVGRLTSSLAGSAAAMVAAEVAAYKKAAADLAAAKTSEAQALAANRAALSEKAAAERVLATARAQKYAGATAYDRSKALTTLAAANSRATASEKALATATANTAKAQALASRGSRLFAGALGVLGGPAGVAVMAGMSLASYAASLDEAKIKAQDSIGPIDQLAIAVRDLYGAFSGENDMQRLAEQVDTFAQRSADDLVALIARTKERIEEFKNVEDGDGFFDVFQNGQYDAAQREIKTLGEELQSLEAALKRVDPAGLAAGNALGGAGDAAGKSTVQTRAQAASVKELLDSLKEKRKALDVDEEAQIRATLALAKATPEQVKAVNLEYELWQAKKARVAADKESEQLSKSLAQQYDVSIKNYNAEIIALTEGARAAKEYELKISGMSQARIDTLMAQRDFVEQLKEEEKATKELSDWYAGYKAQLDPAAAAQTEFNESLAKLNKLFPEGGAEFDAAKAHLQSWYEEASKSPFDKLVEQLAEEERQLGLNAKARFIDTEQRKLGADATEKQLLKIQQLAGDLFDSKEQINAAAELNDHIADMELSVDSIGDAWTRTGDAATEAIANMSKTYQDFAEQSVNAVKDQEKIDKARQQNQENLTKGLITHTEFKANIAKLDEKEAERKEKDGQNQIALYHGLAGAMSQAFTQGSKEAQAFQVIQQGLALYDGIRAVVNAWAAPYPANIPNVALTTANVAALLSQMGQSFSGGGSASMPSMSQEQIGFETGKVDNESVVNRLDQQIELLEAIERNGSASALNVDLAAAEYQGALFEWVEDVFDKSRMGFVDAMFDASSESWAAIEAHYQSLEMNNPYELVGDKIRIDAEQFYSDASSLIGVIQDISQMTQGEGFSYSGPFGQKLAEEYGYGDDAHAAFKAAMRNTFTELQGHLNEWAVGSIESLADLSDASDGMKKAFDSITGSGRYATEELNEAYAAFDRISGGDYAGYLEKNIDSIARAEGWLERLSGAYDEHGNQLSNFQLLLSKDVDLFQDQAAAVEQFNAVLGDTFAGGAEEALNFISSIDLVAESLQKTRELEDQILELTDSEEYLITMRQRELDALTDSQKALQKQVWALEDLSRSVEEFESVKSSINNVLNPQTAAQKVNSALAGLGLADLTVTAALSSISEMGAESFAELSNAVEESGGSIDNYINTLIDAQKSEAASAASVSASVSKSNAAQEERNRLLAEEQKRLEALAGIERGFERIGETFTDVMNAAVGQFLRQVQADFAAAGGAEGILDSEAGALVTDLSRVRDAITEVSNASQSISNIPSRVAGLVDAKEQAGIDWSAANTELDQAAQYLDDIARTNWWSLDTFFESFISGGPVASGLDDALEDIVDQLGGFHEVKSLFREFEQSDTIYSFARWVQEAGSDYKTALIGTAEDIAGSYEQQIADLQSGDYASRLQQKITDALALFDADSLSDLMATEINTVSAIREIEASFGGLNTILSESGEINADLAAAIEEAISNTEQIEKTFRDGFQNAFAAAMNLDDAQQIGGAFDSVASKYAEAAFSQEELLNIEREAHEARLEQFADLGLTADTTIQQFRTMFEAAQGVVDGETLGRWWAAADVMADLSNTQQSLNDVMSDGVGITDNSAQAVADFNSGIQTQLDQMALSGQDLELFNLDQEFDRLRTEAEEVGGDLELVERLYGQKRADIVEQYAQQAAEAAEQAAEVERQRLQAITDFNSGIQSQLDQLGLDGQDLELFNLSAEFDRLRAEAAEVGGDLNLVEQLYGQKRADIVAQYAQQAQQALESSVVDGLGDYLSQLSDHISDELQVIEQDYQERISLLESQQRMARELRGYVDQIRLSELNPAGPAEKLAEASEQFAALLVKAENGDMDAAGQLQSAANAYLENADSYYGRTGHYAQIFADVTSSIDQLGIDLGADTIDQQIAQLNDQMLAEQQQLRHYAQQELSWAQTQSQQLTGIADLLASWPDQFADLLSPEPEAPSIPERPGDLAVPAFAAGGDHAGGIRLVGERGPELEVTGPSRIFNAADTRRILAGNNTAPRVVVQTDPAVIRELQRLQALVAQLEAEQRRANGIAEQQRNSQKQSTDTVARELRSKVEVSV